MASVSGNNPVTVSSSSFATKYYLRYYDYQRLFLQNQPLAYIAVYELGASGCQEDRLFGIVISADHCRLFPTVQCVNDSCVRGVPGYTENGSTCVARRYKVGLQNLPLLYKITFCFPPISRLLSGTFGTLMVLLRLNICLKIRHQIEIKHQMRLEETQDSISFSPDVLIGLQVC